MYSFDPDSPDLSLFFVNPSTGVVSLRSVWPQQEKDTYQASEVGETHTKVHMDANCNALPVVWSGCERYRYRCAHSSCAVASALPARRLASIREPSTGSGSVGEQRKRLTCLDSPSARRRPSRSTQFRAARLTSGFRVLLHPERNERSARA